MSILSRFVPQFVRNFGSYSAVAEEIINFPFVRTVEHGLVAIVDISGLIEYFKRIKSQDIAQLLRY